MIADVRGTGGSQGTFGLFDPVQGTDGATLVGYAAKLPHSSGTVGLLGASYLGIDQFATAVDAGKGSPVKAMFPIISANDIYRDTAFAGGFPGIEFDAIFLGLTGSLNLINPVIEANDDLPTALTQHVADLTAFDTQLLTQVETGGDDAYDQVYWGARNPVSEIQQIVNDGIPAYLVGGWYDLFQRGEPLNYSSFQNAYDHRPLLAPMSPTQPVTSRYQLVQGPWYHVTAGDGLDLDGLDLDGLELSWFDHWLKGVDTGITDTSTPMHLYDLGSNQYKEAARYPLSETTDHAYYLGGGGALTTSKPTAGTGADPLIFTGANIPCSNSTEQWGAGLGVLATTFLPGTSDPCATNSSLSQIGPGTQSYTTAPFTQPTTLAGPIGATLYATTTTTDSEWVVNVNDVAPDGTVSLLTSGLLEGNMRAVDSANTWLAPDGNPLLPYHPYTKASQTPATPGLLTRYDVEVFPTFDTLEPGHRLRVTIATADFPHVLPDVVQLPNLLGGSYSLQRNAAAPSSVELPLAPASAFALAGARIAVGGASAGCVDRRSFRIPLRFGAHRRVRTATVYVNGKVSRRLRGRNITSVTLTRLPQGRFVVIVRGRFANGARFTSSRTYVGCKKGPRRDTAGKPGKKKKKKASGRRG